MDYIRSAYSVNMQFDDAGQIIRNVTWYFAADTAELWDGPHLWGSNHTWQEHQLPALGMAERWDDVPVYYKGAPPFPAPGNGGFCGDPSWYTDGCPSDAPPIDYSAAGVPTCCPQPPCQPWFPGSGGVGDRDFHTVNFDDNWVAFNDTSSIYETENSVAGGIAIVSGGGPPCGDNPQGVTINIDLPFPGASAELVCKDYDPDTFVGTFIPPPGAVGFPAGFQALFTCPMS